MLKHIVLSCSLFLMGFLQVTAQGWKTGYITGEGEAVRKEISLPSLSGIDLGFSGDVILTQGPVQKVVVEGQQNIIDNIKREVKGGIWNISFKERVKDFKKVTVYITMPTVDNIGLHGSGSIYAKEEFSGLDNLDISLSGSGEIKLFVDAKATKMNISGSGDITVSGVAQSLEVSISGSGNVLASNLIVSACEIHISGSGNAAVYVNGDLNSHISGSGDVGYKGNASVKARISGSGEVSKL